MILVSVNVTLPGNQPVVESNSAIFSCTTFFGKSTARYIWKLGGTVLSNNILQYNFVSNPINNGQILPCAAVNDDGANSQESTLTLQMYCK